MTRRDYRTMCWCRANWSSFESSRTMDAMVTSIVLLKEAAAVESWTPNHALTPRPTLLALEMLGVLLTHHNRPAEATDAHERSIELDPQRFNSLLGAARAARATNSDASARTYYKELLEVADGSTREAALNEARGSRARPR